MTNAPERKLVAFAAVFTVSDVGRSLEFWGCARCRCAILTATASRLARR